MGHYKANSADPDQTPHNVVYDIDLQFACIMLYENLEKNNTSHTTPLNGK